VERCGGMWDVMMDAVDAQGFSVREGAFWR
jgi:hypothetical protein